jgi:P27 family predicted phage terminase small subunit
MPAPMRRIFRQLAAELEGMHVSCAPDWAVLEVLTGAIYHHREARRQLGTDYATRSTRGGEAGRPVYRVWRDTADVIARLSAELGLTPSARNRVMVGEPEIDPEIEALLS